MGGLGGGLSEIRTMVKVLCVFGTSSRRSSRSAFGRSTGNNVSGYINIRTISKVLEG